MADRFGEVMIENLKVRGCALSGVNHCKNMDTQRARYEHNVLYIDIYIAPQSQTETL